MMEMLKFWKWYGRARKEEESQSLDDTIHDECLVEPDAPELDAPELDAPELDAPELDAPEVDTPELDSDEVDPASCSLPPNLNDELFSVESALAIDNSTSELDAPVLIENELSENVEENDVNNDETNSNKITPNA